MEKPVLRSIVVLLVIGIIALLAAFVVPALVGVRAGAEIDITKQMIAQGGTRPPQWCVTCSASST